MYLCEILHIEYIHAMYYNHERQGDNPKANTKGRRKPILKDLAEQIKKLTEVLEALNELIKMLITTLGN